ncbi:MAG: HlyD family secretion protein [Pseudomonadota bacterium]
MGFLKRLIRRLLRLTLLIAGPAAVAIAGLYVYMATGRYVTTENAYVKADLIIITAEVDGRVTSVEVDDNQIVDAGAVLFRLDDRRLAVERDRKAAELGAARQQVLALRARHKTKVAELAAATADADFLRDELKRSERLRANGTISEFRVLEVRRESAKADTALEVIRQEIAEVVADLGGALDRPVDEHPDVKRAIAELEQAELDLDSATVRAPSDAVAANVRLQIGEYVEEGTPVLSLVSNDAFWVEANLKETDLTHLQVGQQAVLEVDAYPDIEWKAEISSLSPATGAEYALLPPQNASGNWVKVVQRVPVRLTLSPPADAPPLRAGMSVSVSIDTKYERPLPEVLNKARAWMLPADGQ